MRLINWIMAACFFTASCDIILVLYIGGSVRFAQLMLGFVCVAAVARVVQDGRILWPRGGTAIMLWLFSQVLFLPLSGIIPFALQFLALIAFTIVAIFAVLQLYGRGEYLETLMRLYLWSYVFIAAFGLSQFVLPLLHIHPLYVQQWGQQHRIARINGFSYEPSYFATYMMMGWIMLIELRINGARITAGKHWKWMTVIVTLTMVLCTSKTAWLFMPVELLARLAVPSWKGLRNTARRWNEGVLLVRIPHRRIVLNVGAVLVVVVAGAAFIATHIDPWSLLQGTGLGNTAAHSFNDRISGMTWTWEVFMQHPFVGLTLGGVPIAISEHIGHPVHTFDDLRVYWGFPVLLEVLTASGIFGFIPFLCFVWTNTVGAMRMSTRYWPMEEARWLRALGRATIFECLMLLTDQNVLRVYVWVHLTMVTVVAYYLEYGRRLIATEAPLPAAPLPLGNEAVA